MEVALSRSQSLKTRKISMSTEDFQRSTSMRKKWEKRIDKRRPDSDSDDDVIFKDTPIQKPTVSRNASNKALEWEQRFQDKQKEAERKPPPVRNMTLDSTELDDEPGLSNLTKSELDQLARELSLSDDKLEKTSEKTSEKTDTIEPMVESSSNEPDILETSHEPIKDKEIEPVEEIHGSVKELNEEMAAGNEAADNEAADNEAADNEAADNEAVDNETENASESMLVPDHFSDTSSRLNSFQSVQSAGDELAIREALGDGVTALITPSPSQSMPLDTTTDHDTTNDTNNSIENITKDEEYEKVAQNLVAETLEESVGELKIQSESITAESLTESFTADSISISIQNQTPQEEAPTSLDSVFAQSESESRAINEEMSTPAELKTPEDLKTPDFVSGLFPDSKLNSEKSRTQML